jgi:hypothetical protein
LDSKIGRKVYKDYIFALNLYLIPYFGKKHIHTIEYSDLVLFEAWRNNACEQPLWSVQLAVLQNTMAPALPEESSMAGSLRMKMLMTCKLCVTKESHVQQQIYGCATQRSLQKWWRRL